MFLRDCKVKKEKPQMRWSPKPLVFRIKEL